MPKQESTFSFGASSCMAKLPLNNAESGFRINLIKRRIFFAFLLLMRKNNGKFVRIDTNGQKCRSYKIRLLCGKTARLQNSERVAIFHTTLSLRGDFVVYLLQNSHDALSSTHSIGWTQT